MNPVEKLAAAECLGTCPCCQPCNELPLRHCPACQCEDTGALVPGLKMDCLRRVNWPCLPEGPDEIEDLPETYQRQCMLCGYTWPSYQAWVPPHSKRAAHPDTCDCQGRGWVLIPKAEWMGVLVRTVREVRCLALKEGRWMVEIEEVEDGAGYTGFANSPEEALADAICQGRGIK